MALVVERSRSRSMSRSMSRSSISHRVDDMATAMQSAYGKSFKCLGCTFTGNALSMLTAACLFALITTVQYVYAVRANSLALQADCVSMAVDALAFLGNLCAECAPEGNTKRSVQLGMSGVSHFLLLGFTIFFITDALNTLESAEDEDVNAWIVFGFACAGLLFDVISLVVYYCYGERSKKADKDNARRLDPETGLPPVIQDQDGDDEQADSLTCGINTNMCAALLHVLSDLGRSTTTLIESFVLLLVPSIPGNKADGVSALIICSMIAVGSLFAVLVWMREVYLHYNSRVPESDYRQLEG